MTTHKILRRTWKFIVLVLLLSAPTAGTAQAATYTLPGGIGSAPFTSCSFVSGTTYSCSSNVDIGNNNTLNFTADVTLQITGDFIAGNGATINGSGFSVTISASDDIDLGNTFVGSVNFIAADKFDAGNGATITGNITAGDDVDIKNGGTITGNVIAGDQLDLGTTTVIGSCTPTDPQCSNGCSASTSGTVTTVTCTANGSFTPPSGVTLALVEAWGGGGGGGNSTSTTYKGGGGAGGQYVYKLTSVTAGTSYNVVVGQGGGEATAGNDSTFNTTTVVAKGGAAGTSNGGSNHGTGGAGSTTGGVGDFVFRGGSGASGSGSGGGGGGGGAGSTGDGGNASGRTGGSGKATGGGNGGTGPNTSANGVAGSTYGGGGSGANKTSGGNKTGGAGANGLVIITYSTSTPSPIADWRMDETTAYSGVAGEVTNSVSGGTNGTGRRSTNNLPVTAPFPGNISGKLCGGVDINGKNYLLVTGLSNQLSGTASLSFWVKTTQVGNNTPWSAPGVAGVEKGGMDGANDIFWGYLNATGKIALHKGNTAGAQSTSSINNGTWRHIVLTRNTSSPGETKIYVDGVLENTRNMADFSLVTTAFSSLGRIDNSYSPSGLIGVLDEVKIFAPVLSATQVAAIYANESAGKNWDGAARACPVSGPHHLEIQHSSGAGLTCASSTLTIRACTDAACTTLYTGGVSGTLTATGTPTINWDGTTGGAAGAGFVIAAGASSVTKNVQVASVGTVVFGTSSPLSPAASSATTCNFGSPSCTFTASSAGFLFSNTATGNTFTIPSQVAGTATAANSVFLRAVQSASTSAAVCTPAIISQTGVGVTMGYSCNNPSSCQPGSLLTVNATAVPPSGSSVSMNFDANGSSPITLNYADVGQITVNASKSITPTGGTAVTLNGNSNAFVVAPAKFAISGVTAGPIKAGASFAATVTAQTSGSVATPNFGKESTPEGATLTRTKYQPTGTSSVDGTLSGSLGSFNSGAATAITLAYTEVGSIDLTATLTSGSYLGSGLTATGNTGSTGAVGEFIPDHFDTTVMPGCGTFTYAGQPFAFTVTAKNTINATTLNYDGTVNTSPNFAKVVTLSEGNATGAGSYAFTTLAASNFNQGVASYSAAAATPFSFSLTNQNTALPVTTALATPTIRLQAVDASGVSSNSPSTPTEGTTPIRRGRLRMSNAFGSEKANLAMPVQTQYWSGGSWVINSLDSCTTLNANAFNLIGAKVGTSASAVAIGSGNGTLTLSMPTAVTPPGTSTGSVDIAANLGTSGSDQSCLASHGGTAANAPWLRSQFGSCAATYDRDPSARATFGLYTNPEKRKSIHVREQY